MAPITNRWSAFILVFLIAFAAPRLLVGDDDKNPIGVTGAFEGIITTGGAYNVLNHNATRQIDDMVVPGAIGKYPLKMTRYYNSRRETFAGLMGPGWSHDYAWGASASHGWKLEYPNGNTWDNGCFGDFGAPLGISDGWDTNTCGVNGCVADFRLADGGTVHFDQSNGYLQARTIKDPYGQTTTLTYYTSGPQLGLLSRVTEPGGRYLQFIYTQQPAPNSQLRLTTVEAHGLGNATVTDSVTYTYASKPTGGTSVPYAWCLTQVNYSDTTQAKYTYDTDNQPNHPNQPCPCMIKLLPVVIGCDDVRYHGPMRRIAYVYQDKGPHGAILKEKYWDGVPGHEGNGAMVSSIDPPAPSPRVEQPFFDTLYTESRGDGPTRTFTYTPLRIIRLHNGEPQVCPEGFTGPAPQQFLQSYTDFQTHTTQFEYDSNWYVNKVTDARNNFTSYTRGNPPNGSTGPRGIGQILVITHPDSTHIDYTYEPEPSPTPGAQGIQGHYLKSVTDERGNQTVHIRDINHRITRTDHKDPQGNILAYEEFAYANNNFGLLSTHHLPSAPNWSGPYQHFQYDNRGLLIAKTNPTTISDWQTAINTAPKTTYTYYTSGPWTDRVQTITFPRNVSGNTATETYEYDRAFDVPGNNGITNLGGAMVAGRGLVTKITHADTPSNTYQQFKYDAYGNKRWEDNELRKATSYTYDEYKRLTSTTDPLQHADSVSYLKPGASSSYLHTTSSVYAYTSRAGIVTTSAYDENFRKTSASVAGQTTWFHYDNVGNQDYVTDPRGSGSGDAAYTTYSDFDTRNRKWRIREPLSHTTWFEFGDNINITDIHRPDGTVEQKSYDGMNRLKSDTVPLTLTPLVNLTTFFGYWPSGKLFWEQDPKGQTTWFAYNESDQMIAIYYPDPNLGIYQTWEYDDAHNLKTHTTVNGILIPSSNEKQHFTYDKRNRPISMYWDNGLDSASFTYYADSRLNVAQNPNSTVTRTYDDAGRLKLDQQDAVGIGAHLVNYPSYDGDGKMLRMYVSGAGYDFTYSYDTMGRFEKIFTTNGAQLFQYRYDAASNEIERDNIVNSVNQLNPRDALNRITTWDARKGNTTLGHEGYTYDGMNRITMVDWANGNTDDFTYYKDGELRIAHLGNFNRTVTYNVDNTGNRDNVVNNGVTTDYTLIPDPNLNEYATVGGSTVTNNKDHQITDYQSVHYTYINDGRLSSASINGTTYSMAYDALGRCVKRSITGGPDTYYIYDGEKPILEYDRTGAIVGTNTYGKGIDEILKRIATGSDNQSHTYYLQQNHEGNVTHLTDATGAVIEKYRYDAFGAPTIYAPNWSVRANTIYDNRFLFTGREYAATYRSTYNTPGFKFYEYRARAYSPELGRFMSEDPKLFDAGDYNLFRYCHNDPIDFTDPMGLSEAAPAHSPQEESLERAYNKIMAAAQWSNSGAIAAGVAGYQSWSMLSKAVATAEGRSGDHGASSNAGRDSLYWRDPSGSKDGYVPMSSELKDMTVEGTRAAISESASVESHRAVWVDPTTGRLMHSTYRTESEAFQGGQRGYAPIPKDRSLRIASDIHAHTRGHHPISGDDYHTGNAASVPMSVGLQNRQIWIYRARMQANPGSFSKDGILDGPFY